MTEMFGIGRAVAALKDGCRVARAGWNGKGMWLVLVPTPTPAMLASLSLPYAVLPYVAMKTAHNEIVPWLCSQTDLLADDWTLAADDAAPGGEGA